MLHEWVSISLFVKLPFVNAHCGQVSAKVRDATKGCGWLHVTVYASMKNKMRFHLSSDIQALLDLLLGTYVAVDDEHSATCQNKMESLVSNLNSYRAGNYKGGNLMLVCPVTRNFSRTLTEPQPYMKAESTLCQRLLISPAMSHSAWDQRFLCYQSLQLTIVFQSSSGDLAQLTFKISGTGKISSQ